MIVHYVTGYSKPLNIICKGTYKVGTENFFECGWGKMHPFTEVEIVDGTLTFYLPENY